MTNTPLGTDSTTEYYKLLSEEYNKGMAILESDYRQLAAKYDELLSAVGQKWPNETRHETALRYIRAAKSMANAMLPKQEVAK